MKLSEFVYYRDYNGKTFVIDTGHHRTYRFDSPISILFDLFADDISVEDAKQSLHSLYPNRDYALISKDVEQMAEFLIKNDMLLESVKSGNQKREVSIPNTWFFQYYTMQKKILYSTLFELTYRCPEKCIHCFLEPSTMSQNYAHLEDTELSTQEIKSALDQLADMNVMCVTFTGGEPFVRGDFYEILEYARSKSFVIDIFSNGILLNDEDVIRLKGFQINCFHCSIYSHKPEKHDAITGIHGSFEKSVKTLRALSKNGIYVNIKYVLMEQNKDDFASATELAKSIGATIQLIPSVSPAKSGNCGLGSLNVIDDNDLKKVFMHWDVISGKKPSLEMQNDKTPICKAGNNCISINPYGLVTPCNVFPHEIGNIRENTIKDIWEHSGKLKNWQNTSIKNLTECEGCKYLDYCSFCPGNALQYTGNMFGKVHEACRQARLQYELHNE